MSTLDGWWAEAYCRDTGWAIAPAEQGASQEDAADASELYRLLEEEAVPMFYDRGARGIPNGWVTRMRRSISTLTPLFSSNRMLQDYLELHYRPAAAAFRRRSDGQAKLAQELHAWHTAITAHWREVHFGVPKVAHVADQWRFDVPVYLGEIAPEWVRVELYADPDFARGSVRQPMARGAPISGAVNGYLYWATVPASRPDWHYTPRVMAYHPAMCVPNESTLISWQR